MTVGKFLFVFGPVLLAVAVLIVGLLYQNGWFERKHR